MYRSQLLVMNGDSKCQTWRRRIGEGQETANASGCEIMEVGVRWVYEASQAISIQHQSSAWLVRHFRLQIEIVKNQVRNTAKLRLPKKVKSVKRFSGIGFLSKRTVLVSSKRQRFGFWQVGNYLIKKIKSF